MRNPLPVQTTRTAARSATVARPAHRTAALRTLLAGLLLAGGAVAALSPARAADVGVSVSVSQPGVYGRIDIGRFPQPQVIVAQPVIVRPVHVARPLQPVYLWVPPGHQKNWSKHCGRYGACGVPVYFVRDDWYQGHVMAQRDGPGYDRRDDRDDRRDGHPGRGHGKGHGHGNGNGKGRD